MPRARAFTIAFSILFACCMLPPVGAQPAPAKPTPVKFTEPKISRSMSPEQQKFYDEHPEEYRKAVEEEKALKKAVARHDAATRDYRAQLQRSETGKRRSEIVERIKSQSPSFEARSARKFEVADKGMSTTTKCCWVCSFPCSSSGMSRAGCGRASGVSLGEIRLLLGCFSAKLRSLC